MGRGVALVAGAVAVLTMSASAASASPFIPGVDPDTSGLSVPLHGRYVVTTALDRQTFNGRPDPAIPFAAEVAFSTFCNALGCFAHSTLSAAGEPLDFRWTGTRWEAFQRMDWTCDGRTVPATIAIILTPTDDGTLEGRRSAVVEPPGCGDPRVPGTVVAPLTAVPA